MCYIIHKTRHSSIWVAPTDNNSLDYPSFWMWRNRLFDWNQRVGSDLFISLNSCLHCDIFKLVLIYLPGTISAHVTCSTILMYRCTHLCLVISVTTSIRFPLFHGPHVSLYPLMFRYISDYIYMFPLGSLSFLTLDLRFLISHGK